MGSKKRCSSYLNNSVANSDRDLDSDGQARREKMDEVVEQTRPEPPKGLSLLRTRVINDRVPHKPNGSIRRGDSEPKNLH